MHVRKNLTNLLPDELVILKRALMRAQEDPADSYELIAAIHGWPLPVSCPHHTPDLLFLPWHRKYLLDFEAILRRFEPDVSIPYWDWAGPIPATPGGIPSSCLPDLVGTVNVNALSSAPMRWVRPFTEEFRDIILNLPPADRDLVLSRLAGDGWSRRAPQPASNLHSTTGANLLELEFESYRQTTIETFTEAIEQPHDNVHGHVGFHMDVVITAAFDPIFWLHHANVDRQWAVWQRMYPNANQHPALNAPLTDLSGSIVSDMLDITALDYTYEGIDQIPIGDPDAALLLIAQERGIDLTSPRFAPGRQLLLFENLQMPMGSSVRIRVFKDLPEANEVTPTEGNPSFLGEVFLFGQGASFAEHDHGGGHGHHPPAHPHQSMVPFTRTLNIAGVGVQEVGQLTLVGMSPTGRRLPLDHVMPTLPRLVRQ